MDVLAWIIGGGLLMSAIALVGSITLLLSERTLHRILLPLVAFAAGSLIGGAFFHMIPAGLSAGMRQETVFGLILAGFAVFFALEQFLQSFFRGLDQPCPDPLVATIRINRQ